MKTGTSKHLPGFIALAAITVFSGLALGGTYTLTKTRIDEQAVQAAENARKTVMPAADEFNMLDDNPFDRIDWCYTAVNGTEHVGYVAQTTVNGFGGPMEIIAGVDDEGKITGVSVGGSSFAETPGLGANAKNSAFTDRFIGKSSGIVAVKAGKYGGDNSVDALTSATITSQAVADGVNIICDYVEGIEKIQTVPAATASESVEGGAQ